MWRHILFLLHFGLLSSVQSKLKTYDGYQVFNVVPKHQAHLEVLHRLRRDYSHALDFWTSPTKPDRPVALSVPPEYIGFLKNILDQTNLPSKVIVDNLKQVLEEDVKQNSDDAKSKYEKLQHPASFDLTKFHRYSEINDFIESLAKSFPKITELFFVATSTEGRNITGIKIGTKKEETSRGIWIDAGIHAREWAAPAVALYTINKLVSEYDSSKEIKRFVEELNWYIVPLANPDGYEYTWTNDRFWRKTRSFHGCGFEDGCCYGVDPNRNWAFHFGGEGTSGYPCSEIYRGETAMSEPEVKGIADKMLELKHELKAYISLHSFSQLWLLPYGFKSDAKEPEDFQDMIELGKKAEKAAANEHGVRYAVEQSAKLYPAAGASDDWAKGVAGIKYVYTIELRPNESAPGLTGFRLPPEQIIPTGEEIFSGLRVIAQRVISEF